MLALQILIDGFAISALYGLGAVGFTLMFGVCGVLNLAHGGIMVIAGLVGWWAAANYGAGPYGGAAIGTLAGLLAAYVTYFIVVRPIQRSRTIPRAEEEIFLLTGTLLWGIMIQVGSDYVFSNNPVTMRAMIPGVMHIAGVRTPRNEVLIGIVCWAAIGLLTLLVNRTRLGKQLLAASINPRGLTLLGFELSRIYLVVWTIYGLLAGLAGVLLASFFGVSSDNAGGADRERLHHRDPGRPRQRAGLADRGLCGGVCGDDHRLPGRPHLAADPGAADPCRRDLRAPARAARATVRGRGMRRTPLILDRAGARCCSAVSAPSWMGAYFLGIFTTAYYFGVFAMSWDLLFGFAGEVNFGPTFLIGLGAYGAGLLNNAGLGHPALPGRAGRSAAVVGGVAAGVAGAAPARAVFRTDHPGRGAAADRLVS